MNNALAVDRYYRNTPRQEFEQLVRFRAAHPSRRTFAQCAQWDYIAAGRFRVIAPSYPFELMTMQSLQTQAAGITRSSDRGGL